MSVHMRSIHEWLQSINIRMFNYQIGSLWEFVNPEESFQEGQFYAQIIQNVLL